MQGQPLWVAVAPTPDGRGLARLTGQRIVIGSAAIVVQTQHAAGRVCGVLGALALTPVAHGDKQVAVVIKEDAPAEVFGGVGAGFFRHVDIAKVFQGAIPVSAVAHRRGAAIVATGFGIAQVKALVVGEIRVWHYIE